MRSLMAVFSVVTLLFCFLLLTHPANAKERQGVVTLQINLKAPAESQEVKLWLPYPVSDENQEITQIDIKGNYTNMLMGKDAKFNNRILYLEWKGSFKERILTYSFKIRRKERITKNFPAQNLPLSTAEFRPYLEATSLGPTGGKVKEYAEKITKNQKTTLGKARAIYDWIVDNMHRDPKVKACGLGDVERLLETKGGKCADLHAVFVALARAAGIPAREVFGIRIPKGPAGDMSKAQHCWAEFYLPGSGWVAVDPADVRKIILEQKLTQEQAKPWREYYFGAVDENRIALSTGRDIVLDPPQKEKALIFFMYPYAEADGKPLNEDLYGFNLGYKISFKEL